MNKKQRPAIDFPCQHIRALCDTARALGVGISPHNRSLPGDTITVYLHCERCDVLTPEKHLYTDWPANLYHAMHYKSDKPTGSNEL